MRVTFFPIVLTVLLVSSLHERAAAVQQAEPAGSPLPFGWSVSPTSTERRRDSSPQGSPARQIPIVSRSEHDEIRIETDLVMTDLLVSNKDGAPVNGLTARDFVVMEDGQPQEIAMFSSGTRDIPQSIILVIDHSPSQIRYLKHSVEAARVLIDSLKGQDRMAIISDNIEVVADFTSDKDLLKERLDGLAQKAAAGKFGISRQYSSLMAALNEKISRDAVRQIIIFQTDGDEFPLLSLKKPPGPSPFSFDQIVNTARQKSVTIYTVYTGCAMTGLSEQEKLKRMEAALLDERRMFAALTGRPQPAGGAQVVQSYARSRARQVETDEKWVAEVAARTGGIAQTLESSEQASEVYDRILSDIRRRYVIGYYPSNTTRDGRERRVEVSVQGRPELKVTGRKSYIAADASN
jgi:VWFA-related protein